jgi:hypothetical protein
MSRHVRGLSVEESRFAAHLARSKDVRAAAIAAGFPRNSASRAGTLLCQSLDIQAEVLQLCGSRNRSAFVARFNAIHNAADAEHMASLPPDRRLAIQVQAHREAVASTKLPPPGELLIERAAGPRGAAS